MQDLVTTLTQLSGRPVFIDVANQQNSTAAYVQFEGVLGDPQYDGDRVRVHVHYVSPLDEEPGFSVSASHLEAAGWLTPLQYRIASNGLWISIFPR